MHKTEVLFIKIGIPPIELRSNQLHFTHVFKLSFSAAVLFGQVLFFWNLRIVAPLQEESL